MKRLVFLFSLLWATLQLHAQNLVVNPGFESCKKGGPVVPADCFASYQVNGWYQPTEGSTDWYCAMDNDSNPIPAGFRTQYVAGQVNPHTGNSFAGILGYYKDKYQEGAEYAGGTLTTTLTAGRTYTFSFWMITGPGSDMTVDRLSVFFSNKKTIYPEHTSHLAFRCPVNIPVDTVRMWTLVSGEFVAQGDEQFFMIGNFAPAFAASARFTKTDHNIFGSYAYYYIDDVSLIEKTPESGLTIAPGQQLILPNVQFETGRSVLTASSFPVLDEVVAAMKKQSTLKVEVSGHTDSDGTPLANQLLSEQRALAVKQYLISQGIDSARITTVGYGSTKPLGTDKSRNRRVEFYFSE